VFFGFFGSWEVWKFEAGEVSCGARAGGGARKDGRKEGRKPGGASVKGADGPPLQVLLKTVCFSRLERWAALCFVWVTWVSNRSASRLEIFEFGRGTGGGTEGRSREWLAQGAPVQRRI
jgi:hypothetical protein